MLPPDARPSRPAPIPEQEMADQTRDMVEIAFDAMLEKRRINGGKTPETHEVIRTQEGGVHTIIFRWQDRGFSRNVEGMVRKDEEDLPQLKLTILVHAWGKEPALVPTATAILYRPPFDQKILQDYISGAYSRVSSWPPNPNRPSPRQHA